MFDSTVLDVAVGLVFTFLAVSLAASAATEAWATVMQWRSSTLLQGVKDLLNDQHFNELAQAVYTHALVNPLDNGTLKTEAQVLASKAPAYIDPHQFAQALMQKANILGADMSPAAIKQRIQNIGNEQLATLLNGIVDVAGAAGAVALNAVRNQIQQQIAAGPVRDALTNVVDRLGNANHPMDAAAIDAALPQGAAKDAIVALATLVQNPNGAVTPAAVRQQIQTLADPQLKSLLNSIIDSAAGSVEKIHDEIATWFDHSMDRVSGEYKRRTQLYNFIFALIVAIALNISAVHVAAMLWKQPMVTKSLPTLVEGLTKKGGAAAGNASADAPDLAQATSSPSPVPGLSDTLAQLDTLSLPIGWTNVHVCQSGGCWSCALDVLAFPIGWAITAFATMFGAPFWFDLLQTFIRLKGSGPSPQEKKTGAAAAA
jgi:hypothetical protein